MKRILLFIILSWFVQSGGLCLPTGQKTEARLLWVSRWMYSNEKDVRTIIENAKTTGFNMILFQVRGNATAFFKSPYEPIDDRIGGDTATWDPLAVAVDEAHKDGIQLHAWVNVYPAWRGRTPPKNPHQLWNTHRDWFCVNKDGKPSELVDDYEVLSPGIPAVKDYLYHVFMYIVKRYDIDGLHFDYVRYFGPEYSYDSISLARFKEQYHATPSEKPEQWNEFRRQQVTDLVARVYRGMKEMKPKMMLSAAVWGEWEDGRENYFQDSHGWLAQGIIDFECPMEYTQDVQIYNNWTRTHMFNTHGRYVFPGMGIYMLRDTETMLQQMEINKKYPNLDGLVGYTFFDWSALYDHNSSGDWIPTKFEKTLVNGPFKDPAKLPEFKWKQSHQQNNVGPYITKTISEPKVIRQGDSFQVFAHITDSSGLMEEKNGRKNVTLVYMKEPFSPNLKWDESKGLLIGLNKHPLGLVGMHPVRDDLFVTDYDIKAPKSLREIYYKVVAADSLGNTNDSELENIYFYYPTTPFSYKGEIGANYQTGQFIVLDKNNRIWLCDVSNNHLRITDSNGREAPFSPVSVGHNSENKSIPINNPSGLAIDRRGMVYATFGTWTDGHITKYNPDNGKPIWGLDLSYSPGDIAIDRRGDLFVTEKLRGRWHVYNDKGIEYQGSPFSHFSTNAMYLNRGIAVTSDGRTVYIACEANERILQFKGKCSGKKASFKQIKNLTEVNGASGAVDIDTRGNVYVSDYGRNCIQVFNHSGKHFADIVGGTSELKGPRGVAVSRDGKMIFIAPLSGRIQVWSRK